jgi:hypothetical protein
MAPGALDAGPWSQQLRVEEAPALARELAARAQHEPTVRSVFVTDLLDLRRAYWNAVAPTEPGPERRALMDAGRLGHAQVGERLGTPDQREVRVRREGIVGRIDLWTDRPGELKVTPLPRDPAQLIVSRPAYLEQLAMYCALTETTEGRLLLVAPPTAAPAAAVFDVRFSDLAPVWEEMKRRAELFRIALRTGDPASLPRCAWQGRGCEFESVQICQCPAESDALPALVPPEGAVVRPNPVESERLRGLTGFPAAAVGAAPPSLRSVLYPRRAYFEQTAPRDERPARRPVAPGGEVDLYARLMELLETGPVGDVVRRSGVDGGIADSILCWRGEPLLLKVTRSLQAPAVATYLAQQPQYFLDLAIRCAALGTSGGWLVVGYERRADWETRVRSYRIQLASAETITSLLRERTAGLAAALASHTSAALPACPSWMTRDCPYAASCGCGRTEAVAAVARLNR